MIIIESHTVPIGQARSRLSDYCTDIFAALPSRKGMKKAIDRGEVFVNGKAEPTGKYIKAGDKIDLVDLGKKAPRVFELNIPVIYEDEYVAVLDKPAGLPTNGNQFRTLQNALAHNLSPSPLPDSLKILRTVHRLDAATNGLIIAAKTASAHIRFGQLFEEKKIKKTYHAVVIGRTPSTGLIENDIDDKAAATHYTKQAEYRSLRNGFLTLLNVEPSTGRTHQIRRHLSGIGHPIFGDKLYGTPGEIYKGKGLFLSAVRLEFTHPFTQKKMSIEKQTPPKFLSLLKREERRYRTKKGENQ